MEIKCYLMRVWGEEGGNMVSLAYGSNRSWNTFAALVRGGDDNIEPCRLSYFCWGKKALYDSVREKQI